MGKLVITTEDGARYTVNEDVVINHMNSVYDDDRGSDATPDELVEFLENSMDYDDIKDHLVLSTVPSDIGCKITSALCNGDSEYVS